MDSIPQRQQAPIQLIYFLLILLACLTVGSLLTAGIVRYYGITDLEALISTAGYDMPAFERHVLQVVLGANQAFTFIVPSVLFVLAFHLAQPWTFLQLRRRPSIHQVGLALILALAAFPIAQLLLQLNQWIPLGAQATAMEARAAKLTEALLHMEGLPSLLATLLVVAVLPAIGEELVFRGILQRYLERYGAAVAIWASAVIFSAFHMQFAGFLPRLFLGAMLGYLLYWSGSLWLPIFAHLLNNGVQVLVVYIAQQRGTIDSLSAADAPSLHWSAYLMAILLFGAVSYRLHQLRNTNDIKR